jgi:hypothetical protein
MYTAQPKQLAQSPKPGGDLAVMLRCFRAAAALIGTARGQSSGQLQLLQVLCHCCVEPLRLERLRVALVSWHWVAAAAPSLQVGLHAAVVSTWLTP